MSGGFAASGRANRITVMNRSILVTALLAPGCLAQAQPAPAVTPAATIAFAEGPAADTAGNVYFSDLTGRRIFMLSSGGRLSIFREHSNGANGLVFDASGRLIACETGDLARRSDALPG